MASLIACVLRIRFYHNCGRVDERERWDYNLPRAREDCSKSDEARSGERTAVTRLIASACVGHRAEAIFMTVKVMVWEVTWRLFLKMEK